MNQSKDTSKGDVRFREHRPADELEPGQQLLPDGVGFIKSPSAGRRYLFQTVRPDGPNGAEMVSMIVPEANADDVEEHLRSRYTRVGRGTNNATSAAASKPSSEKRSGSSHEPSGAALADLLDADAAGLAAEALAASKMVKLLVDPLSSRLESEDEIPDVVDFVREGPREPDGARTRSRAAAISDGEPWQCWPNHMLTCQEYPEWGPGGPVEPLPGAKLPEVSGDAGSGVTVAVIDTGGRTDHTMLAQRARSRGIVDADIPDRDGDTHLDFVAGHGTFVAGVVHRMAPSADIVIRSAAHPNGTAPDDRVAGALLTLLAARKHVDIVNLSMGTYVHDDEPGGLPLTTSALRKLRDRWPKLIVVAAAGNDNRSDKFFPAALPYVIGVGAVDANGDKAGFSNFGDWVDFWALGVNLTSSWVGPTLTIPGGGGTGRELARWSGTSFATPMVVGALAAAMSPGSGR
jgi:subtilisin family serine protease